MQLLANIDIKSIEPRITYNDKILLIGSCFTEHIGNYLSEVKFNILQNPNGILFDPVSVCKSIDSFIKNKQYNEDELFYLNECWHSWQHHSRFSNIDKRACINNINQSQKRASSFLQNADWLIITLGSSFSYRLAENEEPVANCHKAPQHYFIKHLCSIEEIISSFDSIIHKLFQFNSKLKIIFTISPVRHLRDGVIENNRSKARLIEATHHLINKFDKLYYFPAYELVIDILRDYRFYDIDLVHPNYAATQYVLEKFSDACFDANTTRLSEEIKKIMIAKNHKPFNFSSTQHKQFLENNLAKVQSLKHKYPFVNFDDEVIYFSAANNI